MKPRPRTRRDGPRIRLYPARTPALSVTPGNGGGVHVITGRRGSYTLDLSRVLPAHRVWYLKEAPCHPWPDGCLVWVSRHGQWHACWDLHNGLRFGSFFPAEACQMFCAAVP